MGGEEEEEEEQEGTVQVASFVVNCIRCCFYDVTTGVLSDGVSLDIGSGNGGEKNEGKRENLFNLFLFKMSRAFVSLSAERASS